MPGVNTNLLFVILLVMQIARLIKIGENRLCDQPKEYLRKHIEVTGKQRSEDFLDLSTILKALCSVPCYFLAPDHMPRRSTVLMVSILSLYFVLHTALARSRWSPHSGFWLIVLRGTKQLYFHFIGLFSETISGQRSTVLDLKKEKKNPRYSYGLN